MPPACGDGHHPIEFAGESTCKIAEGREGGVGLKEIAKPHVHVPLTAARKQVSKAEVANARSLAGNAEDLAALGVPSTTQGDASVGSEDDFRSRTSDDFRGE